MLTQTAKYAIRALIHLAAQTEGIGYAQTKEIAEATHIPANYLGKTMQKLAHARLLDSQKGLHGGFRIARSPAAISLHEILVAIEAIPRDLGREDDDDSDTLPSECFAKLAELSAMYTRFLKSTMLSDLYIAKPREHAAVTAAEL